MSGLVLPFSVVDPRAKFRAAEYTARLQQEFDDGLEVVWDAQREKYIVMDRKAPGGPSAQYVMVIQNPDGSFRPFDQRTIDTIRKNFHHGLAAAELRRAEREEARRAQVQREEKAYGVADDLRWAGRAVVPSVAWDARSSRRDQIREEAGL